MAVRKEKKTDAGKLGIGSSKGKNFILEGLVLVVNCNIGHKRKTKLVRFLTKRRLGFGTLAGKFSKKKL
jgi:hypothetical protein